MFWIACFFAFSPEIAVFAIQPPHVIVIVVDDFGYTDVSFNGGSIPTPYLDALSSNGVRLHRYYTHTVCTPSRMSLLTGKYSHLSGFGSGGVLLGPAPYSLPDGTDTLALALKRRNYSAHAVGKWHLGSTRFKDTPTGKSWGFDSWIGLLHGAGGHYSKTVSGSEGLSSAFYDYARSFANGTFQPTHDDRHSTRALTDESIAVIQAHAKRNDDSNPMFLYLAYTAGHTPLQSDPDWLENCQHLKHPTRRAFCGLVVGADQGIRNVTETARRLLGDNLVVVVTSDNGGSLHVGGLNTPLRGGKNMGYEGGVRTVGFISDLSAAHHYLPHGVRYDGLMHVADWMPTLLAIVDHTAVTRGPAQPAQACTFFATQPPPPLGYGHNQWCAILSNGSSPRTDAVLVMDEHTNFVSYIKPPYKLLLGHTGSGEWSEEPRGEFLYNNATLIQKIEEHFHHFLDYWFDTRDLSFFWHEVVHIVLEKFTRRLPSLYDVGHMVLGSARGGDVMASTEIPSTDIPVQVFDVWSDPNEHNDISKTRPDITADLIKAFNVHWKDHPAQFDWATTCAQTSRLQQMPASLCAKRTSHLPLDLDQRSITNAIPCQFEAPFVADDDPRPCGAGDAPIDLKKNFQNSIIATLRKFLLGLVATLAVVVFTTCYVCRSCRRKL